MNLDDLLLDSQSSAWARFLGTHLPERKLDLQLDLPIPHRRGQRPELSPKRLAELVVEHRDNRLAQLAALIEHTRSVNRYRVPAATRFALAEQSLGAAVSAGRYLIGDLLKGPGGIPELSARKDSLERVAAALLALLVAYQLVFASDYDKSRFWYVRARRRVHLCAHRILELIVLVQQIRALRYQRLEGPLWRIAATVFQAMLECENVDIPLDTRGSLLASRPSSKQASLRQLYGMLHLPWILDFLSWPESALPFVLDYCSDIEDGVRILPGEAGTCGDRQAIAPCRRAAEPLRGLVREAGGAEDGPAILIDYTLLMQEAQADFQELRKARAARNPFLVPRRLARLPRAAQLASAHRLAQATATARPPLAPGGPLPAYRDLRIHVGFPDVLEHLKAVFSRGSASRRQLADLFAQRSALLGEDHTATEESRWHVVEARPGLLRLRTQETRFTHRLAIGSLLVYGDGEAGIRTPSLGKAVRIHRPDAGVVTVDLAALAEYARPVGVTRAKASPGGDGPVHALLVFAESRGWALLLPEHEQFWEKAQVEIPGLGREGVLELGELLDLGEGYCLFAVEIPIGGGRRPRYPQPETASLLTAGEDRDSAGLGPSRGA